MEEYKSMKSLSHLCECEFCVTGKATTHNDPSHDQSLYLEKTLDSNSQTLKIYGGTTKCARTLVDYLDGQAKTGSFRGKICVEVGSGTGLVGIALSTLGAAQVVLTDQEGVLELLQDNVNVNPAAKNIRTCELYWGSDLPGEVSEIIQRQAVDYVVGADLIFAKENIPLLLKTLAELIPEKSTRCRLLYAHIDRFSWEDSFFDGMEANGFEKEQLHENVDVRIYEFRRKGIVTIEPKGAMISGPT